MSGLPRRPRLVEADTGHVVVASLELSQTYWKRAVGLLGRRSIVPGAAMYLSPCSAIHTLGMRFAIDAVFLDVEGRAVRLVRDLKPWRFCGPVRSARSVVELPAGDIARLDIRAAMRYRIE